MIERLSLKEEYDLMHPVMNTANIKKFCHKLLPYFFYDSSTNKRIHNRLLENKSTKDEMFLDNLLSLNNQYRAWYKIYTNPEIDSGYKYYKRIIGSVFSEVTDKIKSKFNLSVSEVFLKLLDYNNYKNNKIEINKNEYKLIKFIQSNRLLSNDTIKEVLRKRSISEDYYLVCISRNPIDYLVVSTNQSFKSCLSLIKGGGESFYIGLGGLCLDSNRFMTFITTPATSVQNFKIKEANIKHFRYISRTWGLIGTNIENNKETIITLREYPDRNPLYNIVLDKIKDTTNIHTSRFDVGDNNPFDFRSKFEFKLPTHKDYKKSMIYLDYVGMEHLNNKKSIYDTRGECGNQTRYYVSTSFDKLDEYDDLFTEKYYCHHCKTKTSSNDTRFIGDFCLCKSCFNKIASKCPCCEDWHFVKKYSRKYNISSHILKFKYDIVYKNSRINTICSRCINKAYFVRCTKCKKFMYHTDAPFCFRCSKSPQPKPNKNTTIFKPNDKVKIHSKTVHRYERDIDWIKRHFPNGIGIVQKIEGNGSGNDEYNCIVIKGFYFTANDLELIEEQPSPHLDTSILWNIRLGPYTER